MSVVCALRKELAGGALGTHLLQPRVWPGRGTSSVSWASGLMEMIHRARASLGFLPLPACPFSPTDIFLLEVFLNSSSNALSRNNKTVSSLPNYRGHKIRKFG